MTLALLLTLQDFTEYKTRFLAGCQNLDRAEVSDYGDRLASADSAKAVDVLLRGYAILAETLKPLWARKEAAFALMQRNMYQVKDGKAVDQSKLNNYVKAEEEAQAVEKEIAKVVDVRKAVLENLGKIRDEAGLAELIAKMKKASEWTARAALAGAIGLSPAESAETALIEQLAAEKDIGVRVAVVDALAERFSLSDAAIAAVAGAVKSDKAWQVRYAAAKTIQKHKGKGAVPDLIEALASAEGRLRWEINDVLKSLTGVDKHADPEAWAGWWRNFGEAWARGEAPDEPAGGGDPIASASFYDIPIKSAKLVFILDRSGSMAEESRWKEKPTVSTGGAGADDGIKLEGTRKIDVARYNLKKALSGLLARSENTKEPVEFNVLFYNQEVTPMGKGLVKLTDATLKKAFAFIDGTDPNGGTNIHDALERGFDYTTRGAEAELDAKGIDTVFLLSDGIPTVGQVIDTDEILKKFADRNALAKITINTVYVGIGSTMDDVKGNGLMEGLAKESGGTFKGPPPE